MTVKRDLKRRVRQRQARTGEAYVTARRHVVAARADASDAEDAGASHPDAEPGGSGDAAPGAPTPAPDPAGVPATPRDPAAARTAPEPGMRASAVPVVEVLDITTHAWQLGFLCRVGAFRSLLERIEPVVVLRQLRELLVETAGDPQMELLSRVALRGAVPPLRPPRPPVDVEGLRRFMRRARAGMGGVSEGGSMLAFHASGRDGAVPILCALGGQGASLVLSVVDDLTSHAREIERQIELRITMTAWQRRVPGAPTAIAPEPSLFVIHDGRRVPITRDEFLIGRTSRDVHLAIKDGLVSRHHAAVIRRNGAHYLKDLGSTHGITYKGMRIDNKRIEEGDVFQIGDHELRFTYRRGDEE